MNTFLLLCALVSADQAAAAETPRWPSFQGANATALTADNLPLKWSTTENVAWTAEPTGYGQSSPIIWGDTVFVTSVDGAMKDRYHITAYRLDNGEQRWTHTVPSTSPVESSNYVSRAAPTPVVDAEAVYVFFESGDLLAITHSGKELWRRSLAEDYGKFDSGHGLAASPIVVDNALVVLADHNGPAYLLAVDKQIGKTLWKTERASRVSWTSPRLIDVAGQPQIVCSASGSVEGYDPATGKRLWEMDDLGGNTTASPIPFGDACFLVGASVGRGGESSEGAKRTNMAACIERTDDGYAAKVLWIAKEATSSFGSPIVHQDVAYWVNRSGVVYAYDARSGKRLYIERIGQSCWATPLGVGDRVYFFGKDGVTTVIKAGPKFEVLAENTLWTADNAPANPPNSADSGQQPNPAAFNAPVQYGVAAVNGTLVIRSGAKLFCLRK